MDFYSDTTVLLYSYKYLETGVYTLNGKNDKDYETRNSGFRSE